MPKAPGTGISELLTEINKKHGLNIGTMSAVAEKVTGLTTGNLAIDYLTGVGGLPVGRITELYGQPSSGKTTTALQAAAALQADIIAGKRDEHILYLDYEHAMDPDYAANLGLNVDHPSFIIVQPNWLEEGAEIAEQLIKTGKIRMAIWDSVAEMTPADVEFGVRTNAMERARLMNSLLQRQVSLLHATGCAGVFLNHLTEAVQMGGRPGMPPAETSPGGKALKFYASLRMAYKQIGQKKGKAPDALTGDVIDQVVATHVMVRVTKNKVGLAHRTAEVRVRLGHGFDEFYTATQVLLAHRQITKAGSWFYFDRKGATADLTHPDMPRTGSNQRPGLLGESGLITFGDRNPDWRAQIIAAARAAIDDYGTGALDEITAAPADDDTEWEAVLNRQ